MSLYLLPTFRHHVAPTCTHSLQLSRAQDLERKLRNFELKNKGIIFNTRTMQQLKNCDRLCWWNISTYLIGSSLFVSVVALFSWPFQNEGTFIPFQKFGDFVWTLTYGDEQNGHYFGTLLYERRFIIASR